MTNEMIALVIFGAIAAMAIVILLLERHGKTNRETDKPGDEDS